MSDFTSAASKFGGRPAVRSSSRVSSSIKDRQNLFLNKNEPTEPSIVPSWRKPAQKSNVNNNIEPKVQSGSERLNAEDIDSGKEGKNVANLKFAANGVKNGEEKSLSFRSHRPRQGSESFRNVLTRFGVRVMLYA